MRSSSQIFTRLKTTSNDAIEYEDTLFDDLRFAVQNLKVNPITSKPDFDFTNIAYLFDDASTETLVAVGQFPHKRKNGSDIYPHVHWVQKAAGHVEWQLEYKWCDNGEAEAGSWTTLAIDSDLFTYTSGNMCQISVFPTIDGSGKSAVSSVIKIRISRLGGDGADNYVGDAELTEFDIHYEIDSPGSRDQFTK